MKISGNRRRQRGIALLMILAITGILAVVLVGNALIRKHTEQERLAVTQAALAQAKEALIAYAVSRMDRDYDGAPDVPGHLPCPSVSLPTGANDEGNEEPSCSAENVTVVGRLPWKTLGIAPPRDGSGECLWYAVSGRFKNNPRGDIVNWDTEGHIRVLGTNGQVIANKVAAVIFAPGPAVGQTRVPGTRAGYATVPAGNMPTCPGSYTPADYLEELRDTANNLLASNRAMSANTITGVPATSTVVQGGVDPATGTVKVNDRIATITTAEIFAAVKRRSDFDPRLRALTGTVAACLADYARNSVVNKGTTLVATDRRMPLPAALSQSHTVRVDTGTALRSPLETATPTLSGRAAESTLSAGAAGFAGTSAWKYFMDATPPAGTAVDTCTAFTSASTPSMKNWWRHWRDHLFYGLAADFSPPTSASGGQACVGRCLQVNGSVLDRYAAVVMFAGPALPGQQRRNNSDASLAENTADADRVVAANYLEHRNVARIASPVAIGPAGEPITGILCVTETCIENRRYGFDAASTAPYNDVLYCVDRDASGVLTLPVQPCP